MKNATHPKGVAKERLDPKHLRWLVANRDLIQTASVKLFRLLQENEDKLGKGGVAFEARMLVGVSFSLWRSVFLSDKTGYLEDTNESAERFLGEMLLTNAIAFSQERSSKDWTFNYYAENARYRLEELKEVWPKLEIETLVPPKGQQTPKNRWRHLQKGFETAVDHFEVVLAKTKISK